jgi:hypothetical protein
MALVTENLFPISRLTRVPREPPPVLFAVRRNFPRMESFSFPFSEAIADWLNHKKVGKGEKKYRAE